MFSNKKFLPRAVPLRDHLSELFVNTSININGAGLVIKSLKFLQPNKLVNEINKDEQVQERRNN